MKVYEFWASDYCSRKNREGIRKNKVTFYNRGMLSIIQRFQTIMAEEEVFWMLVGLVKSFDRFWSFDFIQKSDKNGKLEDQDDDEKRYQQLQLQFSPFITRTTGYRVEMFIIKSCIKVYYPKAFQKLSALGMPIEWYFYEEFS